MFFLTRRRNTQAVSQHQAGARVHLYHLAVRGNYVRLEREVNARAVYSYLISCAAAAYARLITCLTRQSVILRTGVYTYSILYIVGTGWREDVVVHALQIHSGIPSWAF